jgi:predicted Zn-dependent protease
MAEDPRGNDLGWSEDETENGKGITPTIPTEWIPVEYQEPIISSEERLHCEIQAPSQNEKTTGQETIQVLIKKSTTTPIVEKDTLILTTARDHVHAKQLDEGAREYIKLIKKGKFLDEVVGDLRSTVDQFPDNVMLWQTLGDAYMRTNRLQNALDAYSKAEELLR